MSKRFSCIGLELPRWIPEKQECIWCNHYTNHPAAIEAKEKDFRVYYECSNEKCEHRRRYGTPAPFGLIFDSPEFTKQYISFVKEGRKRPEEQGEKTNEE